MLKFSGIWNVGSNIRCKFGRVVLIKFRFFKEGFIILEIGGI